MEFLLELFSEEIPARMQARAADDLARLVAEVLAPLAPRDLKAFSGPRRIALAATLAAEVPAVHVVERGPRLGAPEQAVAGFLRKHAATPAELRVEGDYHVLEKSSAARPAAALVAEAMPPLLRRFPWPKSMRWGGSSGFTWVRPLRRIVCLLDGAVVPFDLRDGADDGHGLAAGDETEGHRFHAPDPVAVRGVADWADTLRARRVLVDAAERRRVIAEGIARLAAAENLVVVEDSGLLDEVTGLVEWPVPLLGRIDAAYMDLPPEVMQVSMRVNQRYFALRHADGRPAARFAFAANIEARDSGAAIVAGNERVLRARFADARHFWDLDRRTTLASRVAALDAVTFHAELGSQGDRVRRLEALAEAVAPKIGADPVLARRAAHLAKADLLTGMVGEFPELQGVMGAYYARHDGEPDPVAAAIGAQYQPKGPSDPVPEGPVAIALALADKADLLAQFFNIGAAPTGSGDPYALRRAALGVLRILRERGVRLSLGWLFATAGAADPRALVGFAMERLRVQLRTEGARHDVLAAAFAAGDDDDAVRLLARADALAGLLGTEDGGNLLAAYRRAANILRIEERRDGPHDGPVDRDLLSDEAERALDDALAALAPAIAERLAAEDFTGAMAVMAGLRPPLDRFFEQVTVNAPEPHRRRNRLRLLARVRATMDRAADFSKLEG
jgi:glycyl-tRNA synthetase beta chain